MIISLFANEFDSLPKPVTLTWDELVATLMVHDHSHTQKKGLPCWSPAEWSANARTKAASLVQRVHVLVLDLDKIPAQAVEALDQFLSSYNALLITTWSHPKTFASSGLYQLRAVIALSRPVEAAEWRTFWLRAVALLPASVDPACKDPTRIYYGPFSPPGTEQSTLAKVYRGAYMNSEQLLFGTTAPVAIPAKGASVISRDRLGRLAKVWRKDRSEYRQNMGITLDAIVQGIPFAEPGERDTKIFQLAQDLAHVYPDASAESIARHFAQSVQVMGQDCPTVQDVQAKIERAHEGVAADTHNQEHAALTIRRTRILQAFDGRRDTPYSEQELASFAHTAQCDISTFRLRWLIQRGRQFYVFLNGNYSLPYADTDVQVAAIRDLAPAATAGVECYAFNAQKAVVPKSVNMLMHDYGSVAQSTLVDMRAQRAYYDATTRTMVEAPCPIRPIAPRYSDFIDHWLRLFAGNKYDKLLDWLALATDLTVPCIALFVTGPKATGKSLLASIVSRLFSTDQPTPLESAMGPWNDAMARNPIVFADESLPKDFKGNGRTQELRSFIQERIRPLKRKFAHEATLVGCVRVMIAANGQEVLSIPENLSADDIAAIGDRIMHIQVCPEAAEYLAKLGSAVTSTWVLADIGAAHIQHLIQNRTVQRDGRFQIVDRDQTFINALTTRTGIRAQICRWLIGYLKSPQRIDQMGDNLIRIHERQLLVNAQGLEIGWSHYVQDPVPNTSRLSQALTGLANPNRIVLSSKYGRTNYRVIHLEHLYAWAESTEYASRDEIDRALGRHLTLVR